MYDDSDLLMVSALQHLLFCPRQCALIHIEQVWAENRFTMEGQILHERVHSGNIENRKNTRLEFGMHIRSLKLGLTSMADIVEIAYAGPERKRIVTAVPIEYKRGKPKTNNSDNIQLCAQAICLEEMLDISISYGLIYYGKKRKRYEVDFTPELKELVKQKAAELHELFDSGKTPPPEYGAKCKSCSLSNICMPDKFQKNVKSYISGQIRSIEKSAE